MKSEQLIAYENLIEQRLKKLYGKAYEDIIKLPQVQKAIRDGGDFNIKGVQLEKLVDKIITDLNKNIQKIAKESLQKAFTQGLISNVPLMENAFGSYRDGKLIVDDEVQKATDNYRDSRKEAYKLANEKKGGLNLSERVWNLNEATKREIETIIQNGIKEGKSADAIQRSVRKYLNNIDTLFRRVRNKETGKLELSQAAKKYHPGCGVYRSAYKNAMRLIRNEVNIAYREAEWLSYQTNPLIKGFEIRLSNNHTTLINGKPTPFIDICDELQGIYPKTFKWNCWHVQCRCIMIPILLTPKEFGEYTKARRQGKEYKSEIKDVPEKFNEYVNENKERFGNLKSKPTWYEENIN